MTNAFYNIEPGLGINVLQAPSLTLADFGGIAVATKVIGTGGRSYILCKATAVQIADATAVIVTADTGSAVAGAGAYLTQSIVPASAYFWAKSAAV